MWKYLDASSIVNMYFSPKKQIKKENPDAYLDRIQNMMITILDHAVTYYNLPANPWDKAGHMDKRTRSMNFWTLGQYDHFIQYYRRHQGQGLPCSYFSILGYGSEHFLPSPDHGTHRGHCTDGQ